MLCLSVESGPRVLDSQWGTDPRLVAGQHSRGPNLPGPSCLFSQPAVLGLLTKVWQMRC